MLWKSDKSRVRILIITAILGTTIGCQTLVQNQQLKKLKTPTQAGINTRDIIDPLAQSRADAAFEYANFLGIASEIHDVAMKRAIAADPDLVNQPPKNVLCLSGGGSYGAFSAGVLYGWTATGTRPVFDTVTGISTGSLIAPLAFLGCKYDEQMKQFYTQISTKDIYKTMPVRGLIGEAFADNRPLAKMLDGVVTDQLVLEIAEEHKKGRRLYVGTTEQEGKQFIIWDLGSIACQHGTAGKDLIKKILLGSSGIPGFFPSSKIDVTVDGKVYTEKHIDGGVGQGIFFRPPTIPAEKLQKPNSFPLAGTKVWAIVAGKLYADPEVVKPNSIGIAGGAVSNVVSAQTRGDLQRIFLQTLLTGMEFYLTSIPIEYAAPKSATDFSSKPMTAMFNEGYRLSVEQKAWRTTPPGSHVGETALVRGGTELIETARGPKVGSATGSNPPLPIAPGSFPVPALPGTFKQ